MVGRCRALAGVRSGVRSCRQQSFEEIWRHFIRREMHDATIDEYVSAHDDRHLQSLRGDGARILCPTRVLVHDPEVMIADIVEYGGLSTGDMQPGSSFSGKRLLREPARESADGRVVTAEGSGHLHPFLAA